MRITSLQLYPEAIHRSPGGKYSFTTPYLPWYGRVHHLLRTLLMCILCRTVLSCGSSSHARRGPVQTAAGTSPWVEGPHTGSLVSVCLLCMYIYILDHQTPHRFFCQTLWRTVDHSGLVEPRSQCNSLICQWSAQRVVVDSQNRTSFIRGTEPLLRRLAQEAWKLVYLKTQPREGILSLKLEACSRGGATLLARSESWSGREN